VVAVPGLVPDDVFFQHLANRRFPAGNFIRGAHELDYLQEPDMSFTTCSATCPC
jgi:phenylalanine-4-hydroxylase